MAAIILFAPSLRSALIKSTNNSGSEADGGEIVACQSVITHCDAPETFNLLKAFSGFIVTNMARPAKNVVAFYNKRGTCEQWIKEGKGAIKWTWLSCRAFAANAGRLQLHALDYNPGNFLRTLRRSRSKTGR